MIKKTRKPILCQKCPYTKTCAEICRPLELHLQEWTENPRNKRHEIVYFHQLEPKKAAAIERCLYGDPRMDPAT